MFIKEVYNNAFCIAHYRTLVKKSLIRAIIYILALIVVSGIASIFLGYHSKKDAISQVIENIYTSIPNFTLSTSGLKVDSDEPIIFKFVGLNFYIDDSREITQLILDEKVNENEEVVFVASDGYGIVKGNLLERAAQYKYITKLNNLTLTKDDFSVIYETIQLTIKDMFIVIGVLSTLAFTIFVFIRSIVYSLVLKLIAKFKGETAKFKDTFKIVLHANTLYILYYGVVLLSPMNIAFIFKMMLYEIISLIYILYIGLTYKRGGTI